MKEKKKFLPRSLFFSFLPSGKLQHVSVCVLHGQKSGIFQGSKEQGGRECAPPHPPTNNALLINFLLSSDEEIFVNKHRLGMQIGAKLAKTCLQGVRIPTELPFLHATVSGWAKDPRDFELEQTGT